MGLLAQIVRMFKPKDELVGDWQTTDEGGFQMMMGSRLIIEGNGNGTLELWGNGKDEPYHYIHNINWKRMGTKTIGMKYETDQEFKTINYIMDDYTGPYKQRFDILYEPNNKLGSTEINCFWNIPSELFRRK